MKEIKIAFTGLDNAGKTSFLIALRRKYNFYELVKELLPTKLIEFNSFNFLNLFAINIWDMGGQVKYRQLYVKNLVYFEETDFLYYIIDIQDESKFEDSLAYLKKLLIIYNDMEYSHEVMVCFSKFDPNLKQDVEIITRRDRLKKLILEQNSHMRFKFFDTTYYDISSLSKAVSYSLSQLINLNGVNSYIEDLGKSLESNYIILYDESGLIIADYYSEITDTRDFEQKISTKISEDLEFFQSLVNEKVHFSERTSFFNDQKEYVKKFEVKSENGDNVFYLGLTTNKAEHFQIKKEFEKFQEVLEKAFKQI
ncbi:MAG: ADP-ribosylation factor-like protein [Promethearchaeota archaeon]